MRTRVAALLDCVPLDVGSRRAIDETLLDWAHEESTSPIRFRRWGISGSVAVLRTLIYIVLREVVRVPYPWLAERVLLFAVLPAAALLLTYQGLAPLMALATPFESVILVALLIPHETEVFVPAALFCAVVWSRRTNRVPILGLACVAGALTFAFSGWVEPAANQRFGEQASSIWMQSGRNSPYGPVGWEASIDELALSARANPFSLRILAFKTGLAPLAAGLVLLGGAIRRRFTTPKARWLLVAAAFYFGTMVLLTAGDSGHYRYAILGTRLAPLWLGALAIVVSGLFIAARTRRPFLLVTGVSLLITATLWLPADWLILYRVLGSGFAPWWLAMVAAAVAGVLNRSAESEDRLRPSAFRPAPQMVVG